MDSKTEELTLPGTSLYSVSSTEIQSTVATHRHRDPQGLMLLSCSGLCLIHIELESFSHLNFHHGLLCLTQMCFCTLRNFLKCD